jgi:hypothetical protein
LLEGQSGLSLFDHGCPADAKMQTALAYEEAFTLMLSQTKAMSCSGEQSGPTRPMTSFGEISVGPVA